MSLSEASLPPDHYYVAQSANNLASVCFVLGKYREAELLLQRTLAIWDKPGAPETSDLPPRFPTLPRSIASRTALPKPNPSPAAPCASASTRGRSNAPPRLPILP